MGIIRADATRAARPPAAELPAARTVQEDHLAAPAASTQRDDRVRSVSISLCTGCTGVSQPRVTGQLHGHVRGLALPAAGAPSACDMCALRKDLTVTDSNR